jgi:pSer/pThr/pTyr-binding forkhead associated (FHA) protein
MDVLLLILRLTLALLIYAFLGAIFWMLWRDLKQTTAVRQPSKPQGRLTVIASDADGPAVGTTYPLQPVTSIGRAPTNIVPLSDTYTSTQHALLSWREKQWWLEDQNSRNGTLVNEVRISGPTVISAGDIISVGHTKLKLEL